MTTDFVRNALGRACAIRLASVTSSLSAASWHLAILRRRHPAQQTGSFRHTTDGLE